MLSGNRIMHVHDIIIVPSLYTGYHVEQGKSVSTTQENCKRVSFTDFLL